MTLNHFFNSTIILSQCLGYFKVFKSFQFSERNCVVRRCALGGSEPGTLSRDLYFTILKKRFTTDLDVCKYALFAVIDAVLDNVDRQGILCVDFWTQILWIICTECLLYWWIIVFSRYKYKTPAYQSSVGLLVTALNIAILRAYFWTVSRYYKSDHVVAISALLHSPALLISTFFHTNFTDGPGS